MGKLPLYARANRRLESKGGLSGYKYRREAGAQIDGGPSVYMSKKLKAKEGLIFKNAPMWNHLKDDDRNDPNVIKNKKDKYTQMNVSSTKRLDKAYETILSDEKKLKTKRRKERDPGIRKVRSHLMKIIAFHEKKADEEIPSIYPILGPCGSDDDEDDEDGDDSDGLNNEKRLHTKMVVKRK